jgi:diamine N-acetyltransferase
MAVILADITKENFRECTKLRVREDQPFVAPNIYSIAQSKVEPEYMCKAIYNDQTMVGFIMYALDYPKHQIYLCRFMIDERHQHKGYGLAALEWLRDMAMADPLIDEIELSTRPQNKNGIRIYEKFGFRDTGRMDEGEEVLVMKVEKPQSAG